MRSLWSLLRHSPNVLLEYVIKMDIDTQQYCKREGWVFELWETDPERGWDENALVVLSEHDPYVPAADTAALMRRWGWAARTMVVPGWRHGGCCLQPDPAGVWAEIAAFCA